LRDRVHARPTCRRRRYQRPDRSGVFCSDQRQGPRPAPSRSARSPIRSGAAGDVVEPHHVEQLDRLRVAAVLAADPELQRPPRLAADPRRKPRVPFPPTYLRHSRSASRSRSRRTKSLRAAKPLVARLLHRQSIGALTGRAAFPLMASALAIAWKERRHVAAWLPVTARARGGRSVDRCLCLIGKFHDVAREGSSDATFMPPARPRSGQMHSMR
jgi:hypothetical protein